MSDIMRVNREALAHYVSCANFVGLTGDAKLRYLIVMLVLWSEHYQLLYEGGFAAMMAGIFLQGNEYEDCCEVVKELLTIIDIKQGD